MKSIVILTMVLFVLAVPALAFHPTTTSCNTCHVTHNSQGGADVPLWSGRSIDPTTTFLTYSSDTFDGDIVGDPTGSTMLCLSCHDTSGGHYPSINTVSGDLRFSHPLDFTYDDALVGEDDELRLPSTDTVIRSDGEGGSINDELLGGGKVKCISCHDVHVQGLHEDTNGSLPTIPVDPITGDKVGDYDIPHLQDIDGIEYTARGSNPEFADFSLKYGALCITCHIK